MATEHPLSVQEKTHYTNLWCREQGIKSRDLDNHPTIDDCILLINFRNTFWHVLDSAERGVWAAYWNKTYHLQFKLKSKHLTKLEHITNSAIYKQQKQQEKINIIKNLRLRHTANATQ